MDAAGLVTEGVGQLIEGEAAVQDRAHPGLFERSGIILLLAPAADHKSKLLGNVAEILESVHKGLGTDTVLSSQV